MNTKLLFFCVAVLVALLTLPANAQSLTYTTSWIGNTFGAGHAPGKPRKHVSLATDALFVTPDGTCYTNTFWDEDGAEVAFYKNGDVIGSAGHTHGWGYDGGTEVTANRRYLFFAQKVENEGGGLVNADTWPAKGKTWYGVSRRKLDGSASPFPSGKGGAGDTLGQNFLLVNEAPNDTDANVSGLAADETHLYVANPAMDRIEVYDVETMARTGGWPLARPGRIALAPDGTLWIIQQGDTTHPARLVHRSKTGALLPQTITDVANPTALCLTRQGRLLLADNGPAQQVRIYDVQGSRPRLAGLLGVRGGIFAGQGKQIGQAGPLRFNDLTGVGCDALGNVYVASNGSVAGGGTVLECYAPSGKRLWRLLGLEFIDCAEPDPASDTDVLTKEEHFVMDYAKPAGRQWAYWGYTVNRFQYPDDPRLHTGPTSVFVRRIQGKRFLFTTDMYSGELAVFRFRPGTDGETAIPSDSFAKGHFNEGKTIWPAVQPQKGEWLWRDKDGSGQFHAGDFEQPGTGKDAPSLWGWSVDSRGDVWQATDREGLREFPCLGLDTHGSPIYSYASMKTLPMPAPFIELCRAEYQPETDTLYLAGYTTEHPHTGGEWGTVGTEIIRYGHWSRGSPKLALRIVLPYDGKKDPQVYIKAMSVAGDYVFAVESRNPERVFVYNARTGALQGTMQPDETVGKNSGWVDTPYGIQASRRASGEYLIFVEEDLDAKVLLYRWTPPRINPL